ncbi:hypothetical protein QN382_03795 [Pseudomonas sp. 10B1]|uniref:hypothetical protein n=1 Tax=unclassified Pseudomonas TaxID=196821 RepID=UPI002AB4DF9D|nr:MULTISPECIES: hypothetical protein [unclassified Pseudomonas]MDY7559771.1 hypothetical protein [Pseudomonas sp. AB6]MEA9976634.1 hypothetical protein [Pseudomonas sp. RTS4]MEA9992992.1 hypothetical protein [Pseudomonas sp. AA4]MEB0085935.1 hypothetical protein [Pseudomonas sp. RTI1]MEB0125630.1 hypothetical protein [Pseudomonas sp. CCC1.2]
MEFGKTQAVSQHSPIHFSGGFMWKRRRPRRVEHDLSDAADNLRDAVNVLLDISVELIQGGNGGALKSIAGVIVALQDDEVILREHAANLKSVAGGRRTSDRLSTGEP